MSFSPNEPLPEGLLAEYLEEKKEKKEDKEQKLPEGVEMVCGAKNVKERIRRAREKLRELKDRPEIKRAPIGSVYASKLKEPVASPLFNTGVNKQIKQ